MQQYEEIIALLITQQAELENRVSKIKVDLTKASSRCKDYAEQAADVENDEVLTALLTAGELELSKIRLALNNIATGKYGICTTCNRTIPYERLKAVPYSEFCIECLEFQKNK